MARRIVKASIRVSKGIDDLEFLLAGGSAVADLEWDDGEKSQFAWFHDELTYAESEFIGLTQSELWDLHRRKDMAYLRS
jgi:hypothetical protein